MSAGAAAQARLAAKAAAEEANADAIKAAKKAQAEADKAAANKQLASGNASFGALLKAAKAERAEAEAEYIIPGMEGLEGNTAHEVKGPSGKVYGYTSLFCLKPYQEPRRTAIYICESKPFDPIILVTIITNCVTMAWESPLDPCCTKKAEFIDVRSPVHTLSLCTTAHPLLERSWWLTMLERMTAALAQLTRTLCTAMPGRFARPSISPYSPLSSSTRWWRTAS